MMAKVSEVDFSLFYRDSDERYTSQGASQNYNRTFKSRKCLYNHGYRRGAVDQRRTFNLSRYHWELISCLLKKALGVFQSTSVLQNKTLILNSNLQLE